MCICVSKGKKQLKRKLNLRKELKLRGMEKLKQWSKKKREMRAKQRYKKWQISHLPVPILNIKSDPKWSGCGKRWGDATQLLSAPGSHPNQEYTVYVSKRVHSCRERNHIHQHIHTQMNPSRYLEQCSGFSLPPPLSLQPVFEKQG